MKRIYIIKILLVLTPILLLGGFVSSIIMAIVLNLVFPQAIEPVMNLCGVLIYSSFPCGVLALVLLFTTKPKYISKGFDKKKKPEVLDVFNISASDIESFIKKNDTFSKEKYILIERTKIESISLHLYVKRNLFCLNIVVIIQSEEWLGGMSRKVDTYITNCLQQHGYKTTVKPTNALFFFVVNRPTSYFSRFVHTGVVQEREARRFIAGLVLEQNKLYIAPNSPMGGGYQYNKLKRRFFKLFNFLSSFNPK